MKKLIFILLCIYLIYFSSKLLFKEIFPFKFLYFIFLFVIFSIFLSQQRIVIEFILLYYFIYHFFSFTKNRKLFNKLLIIDICIICFSGYLILMLKEHLSYESFDFLIQKLNGEHSEVANSRFNMYNSFLDGISFFGEGFGSYDRTSKRVVSDNQYLNILLELGIFGLIIFLLPIFYTITKVTLINKNNYLMPYYFIFIFYLLSMFIANPISSPDLHPIIFWFCIGLLNSNSNKHKINNILFNYKV